MGRKNRESEPYRVNDVVCKAESKKAILCKIGADTYWIPKSQLHDDSEVYEKGGEGTLIVSDWLARQLRWV